MGDLDAIVNLKYIKRIALAFEETEKRDQAMNQEYFFLIANKCVRRAIVNETVHWDVV